MIKGRSMCKLIQIKFENYYDNYWTLEYLELNLLEVQCLFLSGSLYFNACHF